MLTFQPIMRVALYMLGIAVQPRTGVLCAAVDERDWPRRRPEGDALFVSDDGRGCLWRVSHRGAQ
jgi:hypothetical protein